IDGLRDTLVGKLPDPKAQVEQITIALVYKFMSDMDDQSLDLGGTASFFKADADEEKDYSRYSWRRIMSPENAGDERVRLYMAGIERMNTNPHLPQLFRDIFRGAFLPYRDPETLRLFLTGINDFSYGDSESLGDAFEYLLSVLGSQGDAGQFRTPRHIIDMMVAVVNPQKEQTVLDPACGTAGFLISAYKHILAANAAMPLSPDESQRLLTNFCGYDISPDMVLLSRVNLYLHHFPAPRIYEYDTLTSDKYWNDHYDIIMANPPFMSPKGGIRPHNRFAVHANRSEVLFVDYIAEHLNPGGRAGVIVPEGIVFQSANAYKELRKMLVENHYLVAVVSLPAGVFNPYSGVKTSILFMDKTLARRADSILFVKVANDGYGLGAQRREVGGGELPWAAALIRRYQLALQSGQAFELDEDDATRTLLVPKSKLAEQDYALTGERYRMNGRVQGKWPIVAMGDVCTDKPQYGSGASKKEYDGRIRYIRITDINDDGAIKYTGKVSPSEYDERYLLFPDDFLIARSGSIGRPYLHRDTNDKCIYAGYLIRFPLDKSIVNPAYIFHLTKSDRYTSWIESMRKAGTISNINAQEYSSFTFPLPPLEVQREIVAEVESYQRVIDGARQVVESYKPHIAVDPAWPLVKLGEAPFEIIDGDRGVNYPKKEDFTVHGYCAFLNTKNVRPDGFNFDEIEFITKEKDESLRKGKLRRGDVILTTRGTIGNTGYYDNSVLFNNIRINSGMLIFRPDENRLYGSYLFLFFQSQNFIDQRNAIVSGAAQPQLPIRSLIEARLPLPPLSEQQRIVAEIEREQSLVSASCELVALMEAKIKACIARVWAGA
ncbi:MAG: N-6 DNA methylase, partial [Anaerolineae bacterium]